MAKTKLYGLIGYPVKHSYSSYMHNAAFKALGIDAQYELFEVSPDSLDKFFKETVIKKEICGFNVTIPHKESALKYVNTKIPQDVERIGAANTIKVAKDGKELSCINTDAAGFLRHLEELKFNILDKTIAILGAGGAAKAVSIKLAENNPKKISIFDIDKNKVNELVTRIKSVFPKINVLAVNNIEDLNIKAADLLVNATPIGMKKEDPCLVDKELLHSGLLVYDLIYNPFQTKLIEIAKQKGLIATNGLKMLLYQGVLSFKYWIGINPPEEVMWNTLLTQVSGK